MYVAYHNSNPIYDACAKQLQQSLEEQGIAEYHIERFDANWDFVTATGHKPWYLLGCMMLFKDYERIVYLDTDSVVMKYPELFENIPDKIDIGVHYKDGHELLSGVIYLRNNRKVVDLLMTWADRCKENPGTWDQRVLQQIINERKDINLYCLPPTYCQIFDTMQGRGGEPIIKQMQASRLSRGIDMEHNPICSQ
jgi:hypothetical protein